LHVRLTLFYTGVQFKAGTLDNDYGGIDMAHTLDFIR